MLESDGSVVVGPSYLYYFLHISVYVKYSISLYLIHSNTHSFRIHLNNWWHVRVQLAVSFSFSVVHKIMVYLTIDGFLGAIEQFLLLANYYICPSLPPIFTRTHLPHKINKKKSKYVVIHWQQHYSFRRSHVPVILKGHNTLQILLTSISELHDKSFHCLWGPNGILSSAVWLWLLGT